eukprot:gnl/TRDRNA2_/TRDRNA2_179543_c0_seq1.p2 gnl/TRDRNA2_/TRDRNA2_179543_c0~~gnl/TRDRNA2_/TRDRNA2_179543_c0_seq1.p2  ORF type:complete len:133 (+),score=15.36 gnl/TRDRNA2_/TRDRNA2_179543_c0_seq1:84-482(+)
MTFTGSAPIWNRLIINHPVQPSRHTMNRRASKSRFIAIPQSSNAATSNRMRSQSPKKGNNQAGQEASQTCKTGSAGMYSQSPKKGASKAGQEASMIRKTMSEQWDEVDNQFGHAGAKFMRALEGLRPGANRR